MNKITKVLFWGDGVIETGFARVLHSIAKFLPRRYEIAWLAVNYFGDPHDYPYKIYPASLGGDVYGMKRIKQILAFEKPEIIFVINDAWVQDPMLAQIKEFYKDQKLPKIVTYTPVDAMDHDPDWYKHFDVVTNVVAYTEFGKSVILQAAPELESKLTIIPHGIDTTIFHEMPDKVAVKKKIFPNLPEFYDDSFIILNANRNQPRKRIDITLEAFKLFAENRPDNVKLYLHMGVIDSHMNVSKLSKRLGIDKRLILTNKGAGVQNIPVKQLNYIYNATDVGLNTGIGEGFSLTNIEHAITGAPQVVAGHSALLELYHDCGLIVPPAYDHVLDNIMTTGKVVRPEDVAESLEALYLDRGLYDSLSKKALIKFSDKKYSWEEITKTWVEIFDQE